MDPKVKEAISRQVAAEPFAQKFGLKLADLDEGYSRVEMVFTPTWPTCSAPPTAEPFLRSSTKPSNRLELPRNPGRGFEHEHHLYRFAGTGDPAYRRSQRILAAPTAPPVMRSKCMTQKPAYRFVPALVYRKGTPLPFLKETG